MFYSLIIVIPIIILAGLYYYKRSKEKSSEGVIVVGEKADKTEGKTAKIPVPEIQFRPFYDLTKQCIFLLGDFTVVDRNGENISNQFTPTLRALLIVLILSTAKHPDGACGDEITSLLWSDKNKYAARNNRNVSLTKLRNILEKVGHIAITNKDNYWKIEFGEDALCDYSEIMNYYQAIDKNILTDKLHFNNLFNLLRRGTFLPHREHHWLNKHKGGFTSQTIDILTSLLKKQDFINNDRFRLKIADTLLAHDYINEYAIQVKCSILYNQGDIELAHTCHKAFCKDYSNLLGITYNKSLKEILKENQN